MATCRCDENRREWCVVHERLLLGCAAKYEKQATLLIEKCDKLKRLYEVETELRLLGSDN